MIHDVRILMRAASPVTQGESIKGNLQLVKREPCRTPLGTRQVPTITGNSLRHRLFRGPLADHLCEAWGLEGELTKEQVRFLFNGGALGVDKRDKDTGQPDPSGKKNQIQGVDLARVQRCYDLFPMLALMGVSLPDTIPPGQLDCRFAWLVCWETAETIRADVPAGWWPWEDRNPLAPADSFVSRGDYFRGDAATLRGDLLTTAELEDTGGKRHNFPHAGERVDTGSEWYLHLVVRRPTDAVLGALFFGLSEWHRSGATVGGQASRGHGVMQPSVHTGGLDPEPLVAAYLAHVDRVRDEGREFLLSLHKSGSEPKAKKGKSR